MAPKPPIHPDSPELARLAEEGRVVAYFGYGSLVNPRTLRTKFLAIRRAEAKGWQRFWQPRDPAAEMALLSVHPHAAESIHGVVVYDLADHLPSVDEREAGYNRQVIDPDALTIEDAPLPGVPVYIYEASPGASDAAEMGSAILQSYLDAVMQGFRDLYGDDGLKRFVERTEGFETRLLRDRSAPRYPRSVPLEAGEAELFDSLVDARGAHAIELS
ncbi:gamma-glutamylcyclotransferase family protein [Fulvimarina sp. 2208YS6-2-32]|uniref:Gamma-glutamylcyclotransferase family protein n=1 Tax=Fulvimarina uroteuthidis TaxID=3098149 RepID=A0ABU5HYI5_9HYPH|nr:gamma-glutamylcyclotransferase family protein [Fulvimarina sp. 2208YS6-2-32]MDY8107649.1 gamma-glutamylcyclotransferase family protein [Fulvimarina sp. 2208YS6-2-32]